MNSILNSLSLAAVLLAAACGADPKTLLAAPETAASAASVPNSDMSLKELLAQALDQTQGAGNRCAAIKALGSSRDEAVLLALADAVLDPDPGVQVCAALAAGETGNRLAIGALLANITGYLSPSGPGKDALKPRLAAINSIWSLGEIGDPGVAGDLIEFHRSLDDTLRINNIISLGKLDDNAAAIPFIKSVAASGRETEAVRAAAFEMLEEMGQNAYLADLAPSQSAGIADGDMIFAGGLTGDITEWVSPDLPLGHAGIFEGAETKNGRIYVLIGDCVPNFFKPGGVRNINAWKNFTHQFRYPYYGNRVTSPGPTAAQRKKIADLAVEMGKKGLAYDITHLSQKGPVKFDCVGYTEYIYETAGLNPTDNKYETGLGWPLTPWEQFSGMSPGTDPAPPHAGAAAFRLTPETRTAALETLEKGLFGAGGGHFAVNTAVIPAPAE